MHLLGSYCRDIPLTDIFAFATLEPTDGNGCGLLSYKGLDVQVLNLT